MKAMIKILTIISVLAAAACTPEKQKSDGAKEVTVSQAMASEELVDSAEQLLTPYTFMLADKVLDEALAKESTNKKALFYKALIKPLMALKGLYKRALPFVDKYGDRQLWDQNFKELPDSPLKKFLGADDARQITEVSHVLDVISDIRDGFWSIREQAQQMRNVETKIFVNPYANEAWLQENMRSACTVDITENADGVNYHMVNCDYKNALSVKLNVADFMALEQIAAGFYVYLSVIDGYSLDGIFDELKNPNAADQNNPRMTPAELFAKYPNAGKLRNRQGFKNFRALGSDLVPAVNWAIENQAALCPATASEIKRPFYLFKNGICVQDLKNGRKSMALLEQLLKGSVAIDFEKNNQKENIRINPFGMLDQMPSHISSLAPSAQDECGNPISYKDPTLAGLLPDGDILRLIVKSECKEKSLN